MGLEIDIEITHKNQRGIAILKIYGPKDDIKKDNTVTITKSKNSDSKYVVLLAEKIVKPLMNAFLSGELVLQNKDKHLNLAAKHFKCSFCEKVCKTTRGLKGHITRIHMDTDNDKNEKEPLNNKRKSSEDITEVIDDILHKVIEKETDEEHENVKIKSPLDDVHGKKYSKSCENCNYKIEANRKYIYLQRISQHKDECISNLKCTRCNKRFADQDQVKLHLCAKHKLNSVSRSPPLKKKRAIDLNKSVEDMEIDISEDSSNNSKEEIDIIAERSKLMDDKIKAKEKKNEEEKLKYLNRKIIEEKKKADEKAKTKADLNAKKQKIKNKGREIIKNKKFIIFLTLEMFPKTACI